jgi:ribosomal protein L30E
MSRNIWEIVNVTDLVKILKENEQKFVIVALTLQNTPSDDIKLIKKFLKDYSKKYKNLTFLYFKVNDKDLGRISLLKTDKSEYPFIYHIYDVNNIFVSVNRVNKNTLYESMGAVEEYYKKDLENRYNTQINTQVNIQKNTKIKQKQNQNNNDGDNGDNYDNNDDDNDNMNNNMNNNINEDDENMLENDAETERKVIEHQRLLNRILLFEEKKKKHNIKFLEDIQKRKKEESKK